jgi:hypothetical protein
MLNVLGQLAPTRYDGSAENRCELFVHAHQCKHRRVSSFSRSRGPRLRPIRGLERCTSNKVVVYRNLAGAQPFRPPFPQTHNGTEL